MAEHEEQLNNEEDKLNQEQQSEDENQNDTITKINGMYEDWFLDYASYVIL